MGDNFSKQGELDLYFCCPSHSAELGGEGRYVLVFSAGWLQSPEESTALPLSLFCLFLSVQCRVPRGDAMVWRWCPSLCTDLGGVLVCSAERRERQTTRQHPRLDPGHDQEPASLGAPPLPPACPALMHWMQTITCSEAHCPLRATSPSLIPLLIST